MKKSIFLASFFALCSCSTGQIKTTEAPAKTLASASNQQPATSYYKKLEDEYPTLSQYIFDRYTGDSDDLKPQIDSFLKTSLPSKEGIASWYGPEFHGKKTAGGEIFDMYAMTAASKTLPIDSYAKVTNLENNVSVIVRINDRGPFHHNRMMDLSYSAAKKLGIQQKGTGKVKVTAIPPEQALPLMQASAARQAKHIYLQVGAFKNRKQAEHLQAKIAEHQQLPKPEILTSTYKKSSVFKVQMGPIFPTDNVKKLNQQLADIGVTETQFVTETRQN
ncbi:MAG: septal ring lytic transglycosylase RlpA family lipoprotein [Methylobacter sp.]|nr:MAG: septal ring lytic transglycosylase RlpA family lipoprotein [Methylobacter sp.]